MRQAIIDQNAQLKSSGQSEIPAGPLLALADELLARTRQADWLDRAQSALDIADDIALRDLRAVVTQADTVARDDDSRQMSMRLREALARRVEGERVAWAKEIAGALDEGRVVRAVRLSGKVPDPGARLVPELTARLIEETNARLNASSPADQWAALIEAAADSPFRRDVVPTGLPEKTSEAMLASAAQASNRIPALLKLLGLSMPPPPRPKTGNPVRSGPQGRPVPPPPARPAPSPAPAPAIADESVPTAPEAPAAEQPLTESAPADAEPATPTTDRDTQVPSVEDPAGEDDTPLPHA